MSVQLVDSARRRERTDAFVRTLGALSGRSAPQETAEASAPWLAMRRSSIWVALSPIVTTMRSGYALRTWSVAGSQWVLRTRVSCLFRWYDSTLYGPDEKGLLSYLGPLSWALGTGAKVGMTVALGNSAKGLRSSKTIVWSSGVLMESRCLPWAGPW